MSTESNPQENSDDSLGEITMSWKEAISEAWKRRHKRHLIQTIIAVAIVFIFITFQHDLIQAAWRGLAIGMLVLVVSVGEDARLLRKESRHSQWIDPTDKTGAGD